MGKPCSGRSGSPFCAQTTSASSLPFDTGILLASSDASPPSARNHDAPDLTPASWNSVLSGTPVHSLLLVIPSTCCGVMSGFGVRYAARPLPEHSMKYVRVTDGKRLR